MVRRLPSRDCLRVTVICFVGPFARVAGRCGAVPKLLALTRSPSVAIRREAAMALVYLAMDGMCPFRCASCFDLPCFCCLFYSLHSFSTTDENRAELVRCGGSRYARAVFTVRHLQQQPPPDTPVGAVNSPATRAAMQAATQNPHVQRRLWLGVIDAILEEQAREG